MKALWAHAAVSGLVPGGLWEGRPPQDAEAPYATAAVKDGLKFWTSGTPYLHQFTLTVTVWSDTGAAAAGATQAALWALLSRTTAGRLTVKDARTTDAIPVAGEVAKDAARLDADDVAVATQSWELWLQGTR